MNFDLRIIIVEETPLELLMLAKSQLTDMIKMYESYGATVPEWATVKLEAIGAEIETKLKAEDLRELRKLKSLREALKTKTELRNEADAKILALEAKLAGK